MKAIKIAGVVLGLMLLSLVAVVVYVSTLDPNDYKGLIAEKFNTGTGRTLTIDGDIRVTIYPWLGLEVNGVTVGNAPGFGDQPFFHADHAMVRIKLMPLFQEQYEIDTVRLHGAVINLAKNEAGVTNWEDMMGAPEPTEAAPADTAALPLAAVILGGVDIQDASLSWDDRSTGVRYDVNRLTMTTGALSYGDPIELDLSLDASANKPEVAAAVQLSGTIIYDLDNELYNVSPLQLHTTLTGPNVPQGSAEINLATAITVNMGDETLTVSDLDFNALGTRLTGTINAGNIQSPVPSVRTSLALKGSDMALLFKVAEIEPLATQLAGLANRSFDFSAAINADMQRGDVDVAGLQANLLGANIKGDVEATNILSPTPAVRGTLNASGPDLPTLMQVLGQLQGGTDSALTQYGRQLGGHTAKAFLVNTNFDADLNTGNIAVPVFSINALGVKVDGNLAATNMQQSSGSISGQLDITADKLPEILAAIEQPDLAEVMQSMTLKATISGNRNDVNINPMDLNLVLAGKQIPNSPVTLGLAAGTRLNLEKETLDLNDFKLAGLGLNVTGNINATGIFQSPGFSGQINIPAFNLRQFMQQVNQELPETADSKAFENVSLDTTFDGSAKHMNIRKLAMVLDESNLQGSFSMTDFERPAIQFGINIDQINADRYLPPVAEGSEAAPVTPETAAGAATQLPVETLRTLNAKGDLKISQLIISGARMSDLVLGLNARDGKINLSPVTTNLYQGTYQGEISVDAGNDLPVLAFKSSLQGVEIDPLMMDFMGASSASGIGNVELAMTAQGADTAAMKGSLMGTGHIALNDGVLRGIDVGKVLEQVEIMLESKRVLQIDRGIETPFDTFSSTLQVTNGVVASNDLQIAAPGFKVAGKGTVIDLNNDTLNYNLVASADQSSATRGDERYNIGGYSVPIQCQGPVNSPRCVPDVGEIIKLAVQKGVEQKLGDILQRAIGVENTAPQTQPQQETEPADESTQQQETQTQPVDPRQELLNKALEGIFRR